MQRRSANTFTAPGWKLVHLDLQAASSGSSPQRRQALASCCCPPVHSPATRLRPAVRRSNSSSLPPLNISRIERWTYFASTFCGSVYGCHIRLRQVAGLGRRPTEHPGPSICALSIHHGECCHTSDAPHLHCPSPAYPGCGRQNKHAGCCSPCDADTSPSCVVRSLLDQRRSKHRHLVRRSRCVYSAGQVVLQHVIPSLEPFWSSISFGRFQVSPCLPRCSSPVPPGLAVGYRTRRGHIVAVDPQRMQSADAWCNTRLPAAHG